MVTDNFVIFRNYSVRGYWEISGLNYTTYLMHEIILSKDRGVMSLMLCMHGLEDLDSIMDTLIKYTQDPQEDMFIVEINN
jgi:hypothetical protein